MNSTAARLPPPTPPPPPPPLPSHFANSQHFLRSMQQLFVTWCRLHWCPPPCSFLPKLKTKNKEKRKGKSWKISKISNCTYPPPPSRLTYTRANFLRNTPPQSNRGEKRSLLRGKKTRVINCTQIQSNFERRRLKLSPNYANQKGKYHKFSHSNCTKNCRKVSYVIDSTVAV